jgi:hypothetical protein
MATIRELIADLQSIDNLDQPYIGFVRIAEDFEYYDEEAEDEVIRPTGELLSEVAEWRSVYKVIDCALSEINDLVYDGIVEKRAEVK